MCLTFERWQLIIAPHTVARGGSRWHLNACRFRSVSRVVLRVLENAEFVVAQRMIDTKTMPDVMPSATPTDAEIAAWQSLPRDEQLRRLRLELNHPDCLIVSTASMADIRAEGHALAMKRRNG